MAFACAPAGLCGQMGGERFWGMDCVVRVGSRTTCSFESQNTDHAPKFHAELVADIATCTDMRARRQRAAGALRVRKAA